MIPRVITNNRKVSIASVNGVGKSGDHSKSLSRGFRGQSLQRKIFRL